MMNKIIGLEYTKNRQLVMKVIYFLMERNGFDAWWDEVDTHTRQEIINDIAENLIYSDFTDDIEEYLC